MNRLDYAMDIADAACQPGPERPSQTDWMICNKDEWIDYVNGHEKNDLARLAKNRAAWTRFWTEQLEKIEAAYEDATATVLPPEPEMIDTDRTDDARGINAETRGIYGRMDGY